LTALKTRNNTPEPSTILATQKDSAYGGSQITSTANNVDYSKFDIVDESGDAQSQPAIPAKAKLETVGETNEEEEDNEEEDEEHMAEDERLMREARARMGWGEVNPEEEYFEDEDYDDND
jgi:hypothetical protein